MKILVYTSLYPSPARPVHGIFVHELVKGLARLASVRVLVPQEAFRQWLARLKQDHAIPGQESDILRCRFWTIPKFGKSLDARLMAGFSRKAFSQALQAEPDLIHAHYAYPDGAAAALLAKEAGLPLVITCHGSDINVLAQDPDRARIMTQSLNQAKAVVAVSQDLARKIARLGVDAERIHHIPNGVDLSRFPTSSKARARVILGLDASCRLLVAAGRLEPVKGFDRLLRAVAGLDNVRLIMAGDGSQRRALEGLASKLGLGHRAIFAGLVPHERLATYFQAADLLVISSHSEGWPTVIHEALACGTPVVAPALGGIPEALAGNGLGLLVASGEPEILAQGIRRALDTAWDPDVLRSAAAAHDWRAVAERHMRLYEKVLTGAH